MQRKYDFDRLNHLLNVRLNEPESLEFKRVAERLGTTRSRLMRKMIRELIGEGSDLLNQEWKLLEDLAFQVACVGRNLNQLGKAYHTDKSARIVVDPPLLENIAAQTQRVKEEIFEMVRRSRQRWVKVDDAISALRSGPRTLRADQTASALSEEAQA